MRRPAVALVAVVLVAAGCSETPAQPEPPRADLLILPPASITFRAITFGPDGEFVQPFSYNQPGTTEEYCWPNRYGTKCLTFGVAHAGGITLPGDPWQNPGGPYDAGRVKIEATLNGVTRLLGYVQADVTEKAIVTGLPSGATLTFTAQLRDEFDDCPGSFLRWRIDGTSRTANPYSTSSMSNGEAWFQC